jgi:uncharacterized alpha-E superfamily protein
MSQLIQNSQEEHKVEMAKQIQTHRAEIASLQGFREERKAKIATLNQSIQQVSEALKRNYMTMFCA